MARDARGVIVAALESLAAEMAGARARGKTSPDGIGHAESESALREGVRAWLDEVEANEVKSVEDKDRGLKEEQEVGIAGEKA